MEVTTNVFLNEDDVRKIVKKHLQKNGYKLIGKLEIITRSKKDIPEGATAGDVIGINAKVQAECDAS